MRKGIPLSLVLFLPLALAAGCDAGSGSSGALTIDHTNYDPSGLGEARIAAIRGPRPKFRPSGAT
jgi:hypothetical protein